MKTIKISGFCLALLVLFILQTTSLKGQNLQYDYDQSGNRILKELVNQDGDEEIFEPEQFRKKEEGAGLISKMNFRLFPNPFREMLYLEFDQLPEGQMQLELVNSQGLVIKKWDRLKSQNQYDLSFLPPGPYLLNLRINDQHQVFQLMKL